jgi:hypothetical protein
VPPPGQSGAKTRRVTRPGSRHPVAQSDRETQRLQAAGVVYAARLVAIARITPSHRGAEPFYTNGWAARNSPRIFQESCRTLRIVCHHDRPRSIMSTLARKDSQMPGQSRKKELAIRRQEARLSSTHSPRSSCETSPRRRCDAGTPRPRSERRPCGLTRTAC